MTTKHKCSKRVPEGGRSLSFYPCQRPATIERDSKWYCWQHDPERVEADRKKRRAGWEAKMNRETAKYERCARNARLGALATEEMAALLKRLAVHAGHMMYEHDGLLEFDEAEQDKEDANKLAARIKEALVLEENDES